VLIVFLLITLVSALFISKVKVNYNLQNYLPKNSDIREGIDIYQSEFGDTSQAIFVFNETDLVTALSVKNDISGIEDVAKVVFIDDYFNAISYEIIHSAMSPAEQTMFDMAFANFTASGMNFQEAFISMIPYLPDTVQTQMLDTLSQYVSDEEVLMQVVFESGSSSPETETAVNEIETLLTNGGYTYHSTGSAISSIFTRNTIENEVLTITLICIPIILFVLLALSRSYFDIVLFGLVVGVSVIINLGTNVILPDISFITKSMAIVLQIAISLDYVIFMINAYHQERQSGEEVDDAIKNAKKKARKPIVASALTTGVSFLALIFMRFSIGLDIGIVFAKAIVISLLSTIFLLPVLLHYFAPLIDKTTKRTKRLFSGNFAEKLNRFKYLFLALLIIVLAGSVYVQSQTEYTYGSASFAGEEGSVYYDDL
ncbi:MAG TPA: MMPL family transporter, partial [Bacillota bacterium]|nr:MMPL family transporter [Bacillota bacterium]